MGLDEAGTAKALQEHRAAIDPIVARFGGRIVKTTGDGVLLEFPSIVAAVECAVDVQKAMAERNKDVPEDRRMLFRLGINLGDVLIQGDDILGDGVNVAARLEGMAEPGGICVSDDVYRHVTGKLSVSFEDIGDQRLKNITRPVRAYRVRSDIVMKPDTVAVPRASLALPEKPSIAVLPFDNMSDSAEDIYFADGIAEDIIAELSRYPDLFVAARNSSFTYRGKAVRIADVARELGVRYVVEGSVRRGGSRVRITAQLIDALSGKHLWAQRYDRELQDIFAIQDDVTSSIVAVLPARIEAAATEAAARKKVDSLEPTTTCCAGSTIITCMTQRRTRKPKPASTGRSNSIRASLRPTLGRHAHSAKRETMDIAILRRSVWKSRGWLRPQRGSTRAIPNVTASCAAWPCLMVCSQRANTIWNVPWRRIRMIRAWSSSAASI
jgi:TolB-like protein